jgi:hypothetical protein
MEPASGLARGRRKTLLTIENMTHALVGFDLMTVNGAVY